MAEDEGAGRPALLVDVLVDDDLLHQAELVVHAEDGEVGAQADQLGVAAQDLGADGVEGAEPGHALAGRPDERADALLHLARGLVGEGHRQDVEGPGLAGGDEVGDAGGEHPRLAGAGAGEHEDGAFGRLDGPALLGVQPFEIGLALRPQGGHGTGGDGGRGGVGGGGAGRVGCCFMPASLDQNANGVEGDAVSAARREGGALDSAWTPTQCRRSLRFGNSPFQRCVV